MAAEAAAPAPVAAATAAPKRGAPSPAPGRRRRLPGEARSGPGRPRAGRSRCGEWEARPGLAGRDPLRRGAGRAFRGGAWAGAGPRRWGEERGSGGRCPPTSARPAGSPTPRCTGGGRSSWTSVPRGVRWRGATPSLATPGGASRLEPPSPRCQSARKLRSCGFPAGITHPVGTCRCFRQAWAETPATTASPPTGPLGAPRPPGQRLQPGRESRPRPGGLGRPPQHLPREGASFLPFTFRRYLEGIYRCREQPPPAWLPQGPHFWTRSPIHPCCLQTREILGGWEGGTQVGVCMRGDVG